MREEDAHRSEREPPARDSVPLWPQEQEDARRSKPAEHEDELALEAHARVDGHGAVGRLREELLEVARPQDRKRHGDVPDRAEHAGAEPVRGRDGGRLPAELSKLRPESERKAQGRRHRHALVHDEDGQVLEVLGREDDIADRRVDDRCCVEGDDGKHGDGRQTMRGSHEAAVRARYTRGAAEGALSMEPHRGIATFALEPLGARRASA